jgi:hypothetical protein
MSPRPQLATAGPRAAARGRRELRIAEGAVRASCGRGKQGESSRSQRCSCDASMSQGLFEVGFAAAARLGAARERQPPSRAHPTVHSQGEAGAGLRQSKALIRGGAAAQVAGGV